ncbi:S8 family peptidase [Flavobacterium sp. ENC]|uniref:S8 family peptidase n=1 Tax=Flavobacterium sp. ENC TaxID=2897330 RepID=UPI001E4F5A4E|nr:S8 family peptidase [Flavobacterium sp. ENC]MCD0466076.1 S8 family peptidase [Flavobacterium sp. ENC]
MKNKRVLIALCFFIILKNYAQNNWQHKDLKQDFIFGISTDKAYKELLQGKKSTTVVVAILDSGIEINHEDLQAVIWKNPKEKAGNHKDDDRNGYADDVNGWNFLGSEKGNVGFENLELTRLVREGQNKFKDVNQLPKDTTGLAQYKVLKEKLRIQLANARKGLAGEMYVQAVVDTMLIIMGTENPTLAQIKAFDPETMNQMGMRKRFIDQLPQYPDFATYRQNTIVNAVNHYKDQVEYQLNLDFDPRYIVGDNYSNVAEKNYGNNDVTGPGAFHGTHVGGIVGAVRNNGIGIDGVADNVLLMSVRTVPDGDERDKDVANAIRYAVDNGAKVINMSFGKPYSPNKKVVDQAIQYAMSKDVVLVHAAGNDGLNVDIEPSFYPNCIDINKNGKANSWIEVGASAAKDDQYLVAPFSNYGKNTVDVFAPGVQINSTIQGSKYGLSDGTSMAAPVVAGLAALLRSYYPNLTAAQVKEIILKSVSKVAHPVRVQGKTGVLSDFCRTGGVVNAYEALKLAATY